MLGSFRNIGIYADVINDSSDWKYSYNSDGLVIDKYTGDDRIIEVPEIIDGHKVIEIGKRCFYNCKKLKAINVSSPIKSIENDTFNGCEKLESVFIPKSVLLLADRSFYGCTNLKNIVLPNGVQEIGYACFQDCKNLENIIIPENVKIIGDSAFAYCKGITSIKIPPKVTKIKKCAFYNCINLKSVTLSNELTEIGYKSFRGCNSLKSIVIPNSVVCIEDYAFMKCKNLKKATFKGKKTIKIGKAIFEECGKEFCIFYQKKHEKSWKNYTSYLKKIYGKSKIGVSRIKFVKKRLTLVVGKKQKLRYKIYPEKATIKKVTWKSTNNKIAKVSKKGLVTAKRKGSCTITIISKDGKKKAYCKIKVIKKEK